MYLTIDPWPTDFIYDIYIYQISINAGVCFWTFYFIPIIFAYYWANTIFLKLSKLHDISYTWWDTLSCSSFNVYFQNCLGFYNSNIFYAFLSHVPYKLGISWYYLTGKSFQPFCNSFSKSSWLLCIFTHFKMYFSIGLSNSL